MAAKKEFVIFNEIRDDENFKAFYNEFLNLKEIAIKEN